MKTIKLIIASLVLLVTNATQLHAGVLHDLVTKGNVEKVREFFEKNGTGSINGNTFYYALLKNNTEIAKLFLEKGADPNSWRRVLKISTLSLGYEETDFYETFLYKMASDSEKNELLKLLLKHGACPNLRQKNDTEDTPLHNACKWDAIDNVRVLIEHGAQLDIKDKKGTTPLDIIRFKWSLKDRTELLQSLFPLKEGQEKRCRGLFVFRVLAELAAELGKKDVAMPVKLPLTSTLYRKTDICARLIKICETFVQAFLDSKM